ncbi:MAG: Uncharacterised protein [Pseudidiomarina mangrovi]|nr:MAG: Uncharacterised protein [Pseudidiomarina mangrovi]
MLEVISNLVAVGGEIIIAVIFAGEIVKISEKFYRCHSACKLRAHRKNEVHKGTAEAFNVFGRQRFTTEFGQAITQERVHSNRYTIGLEAGFIVYINFMLLNLPHILGSKRSAKELSNHIADLAAVHLYEEIFHQLRF